MFAVFLPALNFRGNRSPYLWWFYKLLGEFGNQATYICGDEYFIDPAQLLAAGRMEASSEVAAHYGYVLPSNGILESLPRVDIHLETWHGLESVYPSDPLAVFRDFCLNENDELCQAIAVALQRIESSGSGVEAVVTCINCVTLQNLCRKKKLPLVHLEMGPLRRQDYLQTAYFDFSGVNGGTEAKERFGVASSHTEIADEWSDIVSLRSLFMLSKFPHQSEPENDLGLGLQIEDDSNIICYAEGHTSLSLINRAKCMLAEQKIRPSVLVRPHPGSLFSMRLPAPNGFILDTSSSSIEFILRCRKIHTINSSVAVEAMLLDRKALTFGDSPFAFCIKNDDGQCDAVALSFFLLNYVVPWRLAFSPEYIRWRLERPKEQAIRRVHLEYFMLEKVTLMEARIVELEKNLATRDRLIAEMEESISWRLTVFLRGFFVALREFLNPTHR